jgi:hypothetical protein
MKNPYEPAWVRGNRKPTIAVDNNLEAATFIARLGDKPSLWGDIPAIGVLNLPKRAGPNKVPTDLNLNFLFALFRDLRNVV